MCEGVVDYLTLFRFTLKSPETPAAASLHTSKLFYDKISALTHNILHQPKIGFLFFTLINLIR